MILVYFRPGGELNPAEDEVEGLKRLLTEVTILLLSVNMYYNYLYFYGFRLWADKMVFSLNGQLKILLVIGGDLTLNLQHIHIYHHT